MSKYHCLICDINFATSEQMLTHAPNGCDMTTGKPYAPNSETVTITSDKQNISRNIQEKSFAQQIADSNKEIREELRKILGEETWKYTEIPTKIEALLKSEQQALLDRVKLEVIGEDEELGADGLRRSDGATINNLRSEQAKALDTIRKELNA